MFIDIHSHVLPGVDDGAQNLEESLALIRQAAKSGTRVLLATPHYFNPGQSQGKNSKARLTEVFRRTKEIVASENIPIKLLLGSETLMHSDFAEKFRLGEHIPINGSRYILVEFPFDDIPPHVEYCIDGVLSCGLVPVIAHPERYSFFLEQPYYIYDFLEKGCLMQINKGSPLGEYGEEPRRYSQWLLERGIAHCIAGDSHNALRRDASFREIYEWLLPRFPGEYIMTLLHHNPKKILLDMNL